jgi:hypothetical protein
VTVRPVHAASLGVAGALVAGLVLVPVSTASAVDADGPSFYAIAADSGSSDASGQAERRTASAERSVTRTAAKASVAKKTQILQVMDGIQVPGAEGVSVATGPKQVVQATGVNIRAYTKATGAIPAKGNKTLSAFFAPGAGVTVSQPVLAYDPIGKRFIAVAITSDGGDTGLAMRVSKGSVAAPLTNKKWRSTVFFGSSTSGGETVASQNIDEWNPQLGVSSDKIAVTTVADDPDEATIANRIFILPKGAYFKGNEPGVWAADVDSTYNGQAPAVNATKQANAFIAIPDTNDVTVATYTGAAKDNPPTFSKNVVYPASAMAAPPVVAQTGGDGLDLGGLAFTGVAWRNNKLYAAATINSGGRAAVRVFGINTGSGVSLSSVKTLSNQNADWFSPDLAIDKGGNVLVVAQDERDTPAVGPSLAVWARKSNGTWLKSRFVEKSAGAVSGPGNPTDWWNSTGAALDPTSPWDVWVSGSVGPAGTDVARVSLAKNKASIKASSTKVKKGNKVTFTVKLTRPDSKDTIKGLPVALQKSPKSKNSFKTVKSGKTSAKGTAQWKLKVKKASKYRTLGKAVKQNNGAGRVFDAVKSKPVTVNLK